MGETNREAWKFSVVSDHRAMTQPEETGFGGSWPHWEPEEWEHIPGLECPWGKQGGDIIGLGTMCAKAWDGQGLGGCGDWTML